MITKKIFERELVKIFNIAEQEGRSSIEIRAGDLHQHVGGYPKINRMPMCCNVMRKMLKEGDQVLQKPPKGDGANFIIRYKIPRLSHQYWVELYWPTKGERDLSTLYIWFHEKKKKRNNLIKTGDRVLFYEVWKHPTEEYRGSKTLFASGTVLDETIYIPDEDQWRGGKRWLIKRTVRPDYTIPPAEGIPLEVLKKIRGKQGWPRSGFQIRDIREFDRLERELIKKREVCNKDISDTIREGNVFTEKTKKQFQLSDKDYNAADRLVSLERSTNAHKDLLNKLNKVLCSHEHVAEENQNIDLFITIKGVRWIFEVKSTHNRNFLSQVRHGIAQLFEYRYIYGKDEQVNLCLVVQTPPPDELKWLIGYLESINIKFYWPVPKGFFSAYGEQIDVLVYKMEKEEAY